MVEIYIDGASLGNPGRIGVGYVIYRAEKRIKSEGIYLGQNTNNFAEYMAFIFALIEANVLGITECKVYSDSKLLCEQIHGRYKVKNNNIVPLHLLVKKVMVLFKKVNLIHIPREKNKEADALAKQAARLMCSCGNRNSA